jgi:hypothetical protein
VTAAAPGVIASQMLLGPARASWVAVSSAGGPPRPASAPVAGLANYRDHSALEPVGPETALPAAERLHATLLGLGIGTLALAAATAGGLAISAGPFHTSLGSLA